MPNYTITIAAPPKGLKEAVQRAAFKQGLSVGRYVARLLVRETMQKKQRPKATPLGR